MTLQTVNLRITQIQKKMKTLVVTLLLTLILTGCEDIYPGFRYFKGTGSLQIEKHNVPAFTEIESSIDANITIIRGTSHSVTVTAQGNILPYIRTTISNGKLHISTGNFTIHSDSLISIEIVVPELETISLSGCGVIRSECAVQRISLSGAGEVICTGATDQVEARLSGTGVINLAGMQVRIAEIRISGNGNVKVNAWEQLDVSISGMGNVYYIGNPKLNQKISGIGNVVRL
jgi:hypothetical protein